ncbi:hypothetical protein L1987_58275 [Smallanthus sonchifolius]|uniref:Uncharacterized protein n=1 Tax=Smallanthus sonchifolius TaxID=185202 RepID=A0ACB9DEV3_9ASTR|nr:hypothetical protein L1987_58275 [Smallanthus sonchifolius]
MHSLSLVVRKNDDYIEANVGNTDNVDHDVHCGDTEIFDVEDVSSCNSFSSYRVDDDEAQSVDSSRALVIYQGVVSTDEEVRTDVWFTTFEEVDMDVQIIACGFENEGGIFWNGREFSHPSELNMSALSFEDLLDIHFLELSNTLDNVLAYEVASRFKDEIIRKVTKTIRVRKEFAMFRVENANVGGSQSSTSDVQVFLMIILLLM